MRYKGTVTRDFSASSFIHHITCSVLIYVYTFAGVAHHKYKIATICVFSEVKSAVVVLSLYEKTCERVGPVPAGDGGPMVRGLGNELERVLRVDGPVPSTRTHRLVKLCNTETDLSIADNSNHKVQRIGGKVIISPSLVLLS